MTSCLQTDTQVKLKRLFVQYNTIQVYLKITLKTTYQAYADDLSATTKVSIVPIPTALVIRNWQNVWDMINELKAIIQADLEFSDRVPRDQTYITSYTI